MLRPRPGRPEPCPEWVSWAVHLQGLSPTPSAPGASLSGLEQARGGMEPIVPSGQETLSPLGGPFNGTGSGGAPSSGWMGGAPVQGGTRLYLPLCVALRVLGPRPCALAGVQRNESWVSVLSSSKSVVRVQVGRGPVLTGQDVRQSEQLF